MIFNLTIGSHIFTYMSVLWNISVIVVKYCFGWQSIPASSTSFLKILLNRWGWSNMNNLSNWRNINPIPIATVAKITRTVGDLEISSFKIISFIANVCGAWYCANILFSGIGSAPGGKYCLLPRMVANNLYANPHHLSGRYKIVIGYFTFISINVWAIGVSIFSYEAISSPSLKTLL